MTLCIYWQLFKVARVLLLFIYLMQEFFLLQAMDFILVDEEKHIREQNHIPSMYVLVKHLCAWQVPITSLT